MTSNSLMKKIWWIIPFWRKEKLYNQGIEQEEIIKNRDSELNLTIKDKTNVPDISENVNKMVINMIEWWELNKIRYFLMEIIRKNTWILTPSVEIWWYKSETITVNIPWKYKSEASIYRIIMQESIKMSQIPVDENSVLLWNISVKIQEWYNKWVFNINLNWKIQNEDLERLRDFFERVYLWEFTVNEHNSINALQIKELLELSEKDFVIMDEKSIEISIPMDKEIEISEKTLETIAIALNNQTDDYSIKYKWFWVGCNSWIEHRKFIIYDINNKNKYIITSGFSDWKLTVRIWDNYSWIELNRKFIEQILKNYIYLLGENIIKKMSALDSLRWAWVLVFEKNPNETRKTLEELYAEEWFVGYEDIKELLSINIIYPWEKKEEYRAITKNRFPNIKNIIPNTVLFEWPPWTWKTTQAKIIWKYLWYPFIYIPIWKLMSKWYWESEWRLDKIFELARKAAEQNWWIIAMIDEIDEIWKNREESHEATWRMTWVLLKKLDWIEQVSNLLLIWSTNRKDSMDEALLSRFSKQMFFRLPNMKEIRHILEFYIPESREIDNDSLITLKWKSWRDIKNISEDIARKFFEEKIIKNSNPVMKQIISDYLKGIDTDFED